MKKGLLLLVALVFSLGSVMAQDKIVDSDYVIFQDGEVVQYVDGHPKTITATVTLKNGATVSPDGSFTAKGKSGKLQDGQCFGMSGKMYKSEEKLFAHLQKEKKKLLSKMKK